MIKRLLSTVTSSASNDDINEGFRKIIPTSLNYSNGTIGNQLITGFMLYLKAEKLSLS